MATWLERDQLGKNGQFIARTRAALINRAVQRLLDTVTPAEPPEIRQAQRFIESPDQWAIRFATLIAAYGPGVGTGTGTNANGDPAPNTTNGDLALAALVAAAWNEFF